VKFKLDENLPVEAADMLREKGHDAHSVHDERMCGAPDASIAQICSAEERTLVTLDLDFADIRHYPPSSYFGINVLRLARADRLSVMAILPRILELLETEPVLRRLWIVDENRTRIRDEP
jgi:predicted nuclease of predicted toxin-antitoxin system